MTTTADALSSVSKMVPLFCSFVFRKIRLFSIFRVPVFLNSSVLIIPLILFFTGNLNFWAGVYILAIGVSVLLHEFGHAVAGQMVGNPAKEISIIACGGYTIFARNPGVTAKDAFMSVAGPLTNGFICYFLLWIESFIVGVSFADLRGHLFSQIIGPETSFEGMPFSFVILNSIALVNAYMFLFNLLPAFPLDGGRIFRWISGCFFTQEKAAFSTMLVARMLACFIVGRSLLIDLISEFNLFNLITSLLIGSWIWYGSKAELWRTKLYCAAESGSHEALSEIHRIFNEEILVRGRR